MFSICNLYSRGEKVFSEVNIPLCKLANNIIRWALNTGNYQLAAKYTEKTLSCFRSDLALSIWPASVREV